MSIQSNIVNLTSLAGRLAQKMQAKAEPKAQEPTAMVQPPMPQTQPEISEKETFKKQNTRPRDSRGRFSKLQQQAEATASAQDSLQAEQERRRKTHNIVKVIDYRERVDTML